MTERSKFEVMEGGNEGEPDQRGIQDSLRRSGFSEAEIDLHTDRKKTYLVPEFRSRCGNVVLLKESNVPFRVQHLDKGLAIVDFRDDE